MDWEKRLKSLIVDSSTRGVIKSKLLDKPDEFRNSLFDDDDDAVRSALVSLIEPVAGAGERSGMIELFTIELSNIYKRVNELRDSLGNLMNPMSGFVPESLSQTRAASSISKDDIGALRFAFGAVTDVLEKDVTLEALLGAEAEEECIWDATTYELRARELYFGEFTSLTQSRYLSWKDVTAEKCIVKFPLAEFSVAAKNDLLLCVRKYSAIPGVGAILGVEITRKLSPAALRQAEVEFYVWSHYSQFPFIQVVTDMEHGGVAIYSTGGRDVTFRTFGSMRAVYDFVRGVDENLPPDFGKDELTIDTLSAPARKRFTPEISVSGRHF